VRHDHRLRRLLFIYPHLGFIKRGWPMPWYRVKFLGMAGTIVVAAAIQAAELDRAIQMARKLAGDRTPVATPFEIWQGGSRLHSESCSHSPPTAP
jgi:hypothetical protein